MKIICTTERKIEEETTCKKEYCCTKLKTALNAYKNGKDSYDWIPSNFTVEKDKILIETHDSYHEGSHDMPINFCPWCGIPIKIERIKVDNTGLPPKEPPQPPLSAVSPKKRHWWSK